METPMTIAIENGHLEVVKCLVERKASIELPVLHRACQYGQMTIVNYLLESKANINASTKNTGPPIEYAAGYWETALVAHLLDQKADAEEGFEEFMKMITRPRNLLMSFGSGRHIFDLFEPARKLQLSRWN
jgi:hypothetical protein